MCFSSVGLALAFHLGGPGFKLQTWDNQNSKCANWPSGIHSDDKSKITI